VDNRRREDRTDYFSIRTREALFVVFVRTRPWKKLLRGVRKDKFPVSAHHYRLCGGCCHLRGFGEGCLDREMYDCIVNQPQSTPPLSSIRQSTSSPSSPAIPKKKGESAISSCYRGCAIAGSLVKVPVPTRAFHSTTL